MKKAYAEGAKVTRRKMDFGFEEEPRKARNFTKGKRLTWRGDGLLVICYWLLVIGVEKRNH